MEYTEKSYELSCIVSPIQIQDKVMINMTTGLLTVQVILESEAIVEGFILITVRELSARAAGIMFHRLLLQRQMCHLVCLQREDILQQWWILQLEAMRRQNLSQALTHSLFLRM